MTENDAWNRKFLHIEEISTWQSQLEANITNNTENNKRIIVNKLDEKTENKDIENKFSKINTESKLKIHKKEFDCKHPKFCTDVRINSKFCIR